MSLWIPILALLQAQEPPQAAAPKADEIPLEVYFKDGIRFRAKDGSFEARIGGRMLAQVRTIFDRPDEEPGAAGAPMKTLPDAAYVRQARLETEGTYRKEFGYRVQIDVATGQFNQSTGAAPSNVSGTMRDAYLEWKRWEELQIRFGQFYEPVSQEDISSIRFLELIERSVMNRLLPGRDVGLQVSGALFERSFTYAVMGCAGGGLLNDQGRAVTDRDDEKELGGLLRWSPFLHGGDPLLKGLRVSLGASAGSVDDVPATGFDLLTPELSVMYLDASAGGNFDGLRRRLVPQLSWAVGPAALRAEYLVRRDELDGSFAEDELESEGWYVSASVFLTGEEKRPEERPVPSGEWGAVEVAARIARVTIENGFESGLALPAGNSETATTFTAGVSWWPTRNIRLSGNVVVESYDDAIAFDHRDEDSLVGLLFRAQIDF